MREQSTTRTECTDQTTDRCCDIDCADINDLLNFDDGTLGLDSDAQHDIDALARMVEEIDQPHLPPPPTPSPTVYKPSPFAALAALIPVVSIQPLAVTQSVATVQPTAIVQPAVAVAAPAALGEVRESLQWPPPASKEQRKLKVQRYLYKRSRRVWTKGVNARRSESTAKRQRTGQGRFVRSTTKWVSC